MRMFRFHERILLWIADRFDRLALEIRCAEQERRRRVAVPDGTTVVLACDEPVCRDRRGEVFTVRRYEADFDTYTLEPIGKPQAWFYHCANRECFEVVDVDERT